MKINKIEKEAERFFIEFGSLSSEKEILKDKLSQINKRLNFLKHKIKKYIKKEMS